MPLEWNIKHSCYIHTGSIVEELCGYTVEIVRILHSEGIRCKCGRLADFRFRALSEVTGE